MRQASGNFPFHRDIGTCVILCPFGKHEQHDSPHLRTLASWSSFCLSFSIKLVEPASQPLYQILLLAWCHLVPRLSVGEKVIASTGKDPTSLMLQCKRLHGEEQVVSHPISALDGLYTALFCLKLGNSALLAIRGALLLNHQIVWLNIKL